MPLRKTLFCTIGGSHQPILEAVSHHEPDEVVFVCSKDDPSTGRTGSYSMITAEGNVCRSSRAAPADLPNIPTQLGLDDDDYRVVLVPSDSPEAIVDILRSAVAEAAENGYVIADYTGGTKTMAAVLFHLAVTTPGVDISLVGGPRANLDAIIDGTQSVQHKDSRSIRHQWILEETRRTWSRYAYGEADQLLSSIGSDDPQITKIRNLSRGYAAWNAAQYATAYEILQIYGRDVGRYLASLNHLCHLNRDSRSESTFLWDMWLRCLRRHETGRHDTATLLLYRVFEGLAQWTLRTHHDIDTSDVPQSIAEAHDDLVHPGRDGKFKLALESAWRLIAELDGPLSGLATHTFDARKSLQTTRNQSIYTHGYTPVSAEDFSSLEQWMRDDVLPTFLDEAFGGSAPFEQLPNSFPN